MSEINDGGQRNSGTEIGWSVEARSSLDDYPILIAEQVFTTKWKTVRFDLSEFGVPAGDHRLNEYLHFGLLSYPAAQAIRWWFIATLEVKYKTHVETRLVRHEVKYERSARRVAEYAAISTFEENRAAYNCTAPAAATKGQP